MADNGGNGSRFWQAAKKILTLGYDASERTNRRRNRPVDRRGEDDVLDRHRRDVVVSDARDLRRNYTIAAWAMRTHLDYTSTFNFQSAITTSKLDDAAIEKLDGDIEAFMKRWSRPENCDVSGRYGMAELIRMAEAARLSDGDVFIMKLSDGRFQIVEGDRVRTPTDLGEFKGQFKPEDFVQGIQVTATGKPLRYAVCERVNGNGYRLKAVIPAKYVFRHGFYDRYDQVRGVSPLVAAINPFADLYEAAEYTLAKMKLSQLLGLKITSKDDGLPEGDTGDQTPISFDFGGGPQLVQLAPGDDADFLESANPSDQFQTFFVSMIQASLKALDIPYSFYAENYTNYSGARQALLQYQQSVSIKQRAVKRLLDDLTAWRLSLAVMDGELVLPAGITVDDLTWDWVPNGLPWIDPKKEAEADILLITNQLDSREDVCRARGKDWYSIVEKQAKEVAWMKKHGIDPAAANKAGAPVAEQGDEDEQAAA